LHEEELEKQSNFPVIALAVAALVSTSSAVYLTKDEPAESNLLATEIAAEHNWDLAEIFEAVDANGDGALTMKEVCTAIKAYAKEHGWKLPKGWRKHVKAIFNHVDADKNGKVTLDEIHAAIFDAVDTDNDGHWSLVEIQEALQAVAKHLGKTLKKGWKKEVRQAFKAVDTDKNGLVSGAELKAAIKAHGYPDLDELMN